MNEGVMIFGGIEELRKKIIEVKTRKPKVLFILTTCPSGIIGDNIDFVRDLEDEETKIIPLLADGNLQGDYLQGILMAYMEISRALIDKNISPRENTVNIVAEKPETNSRAASLKYVKEILDRFGIEINSHFLCETSVDEIRGLLRGKLNILAYDDYMGRTVRDFLQSKFGANFLDSPFPIGFKESCEWVRKVGEYFHKSPEETEALICDYKQRYAKEIAAIKPHLKGKKLMIVIRNHTIDWILQTACDLEMDIVFTGIMNYSQDNLFRTSYKENIRELHIPYDANRRKADIARIQPDLLISNYSSADQNGKVLTDTLPLCPTAGFLSGVLLAKRWSEIFKMNLKEGWKEDEVLFRKYFA
jgi:nitrogenase molybdenum-iron protein alpha/beta subunit